METWLNQVMAGLEGFYAWPDPMQSMIPHDAFFADNTFFDLFI